LVKAWDMFLREIRLHCDELVGPIVKCSCTSMDMITREHNLSEDESSELT